MATKKKTDEKTCSSCNSTQTIITAVAVVAALAAIVYALTVKTGEKQATAYVPSMDVAEVTYESGPNNPVVMMIGDREITRAAVIDNFESSGSQLPEGANMEQVFPLLQDQYLVGELLKQAALNNGFSKETPEVARRMNDAYAQALRAAYIQSVGENQVNEAEVRQAYEDIVENSPAVEERRASHILVQDEETANALIEQLNDGADFAQLAEENSVGPTSVKGGDLGYFAKSEMVPAFANAAFEMEIGSVSEAPVQTQFGYHIIKVVDERTREKPDYETIKPQIESQLRQAVLAEEVQKLRAASDITVYTFDGEEMPDTPQAGQQAPQTEAPTAGE